MKLKLFNLLIIIAMLIITIITIIPLPDIVPVHFNIKGEADDWGSKWTMLLMPIINMAMFGFWLGCEKGYVKKSKSDDDKERAEALANIKVFNVTFTICTFIFAALNVIFMYLTVAQIDGDSSHSLDVMKITTIIMGIMFIFLGNIMPKTKNNPNVGFRLPWTRFNDVTWYKCNRAGGIAMVVTGVITTIGGLIFDNVIPMMIMISAVTLSIVVISVYAYLVYREEKADEKQS